MSTTTPLRERVERQPMLPGLDGEPMKVSTTKARDAITEALTVIRARVAYGRRLEGLTPWERLAVDLAEVQADVIEGAVPGYMRQATARALGRRALALLAFTAWLEVPR